MAPPAPSTRKPCRMQVTKDTAAGTSKREKKTLVLLPEMPAMRDRSDPQPLTARRRQPGVGLQGWVPGNEMGGFHWAFFPIRQKFTHATRLASLRVRTRDLWSLLLGPAATPAPSFSKLVDIPGGSFGRHCRGSCARRTIRSDPGQTVPAPPARTGCPSPPNLMCRVHRAPQRPASLVGTWPCQDAQGMPPESFAQKVDARQTHGELPLTDDPFGRVVPNTCGSGWRPSAEPVATQPNIAIGGL